MPIDTYELDIRSCFKEGSIQELWYGGTEGLIGEEEDKNKIYVAITEDDNWWLNKCVMRDWFFDYEKFKTLPVGIDCASYGVYEFWVAREPNPNKFD